MQDTSFWVFVFQVHTGLSCGAIQFRFVQSIDRSVGSNNCNSFAFRLCTCAIHCVCGMERSVVLLSRNQCYTGYSRQITQNSDLPSA